MDNSQISFIGAGNMATSLIHGLLGKDVPADHIHATDIDTDKLAQLSAETGIQTGSLEQVAAVADVVVLAVKPQVMETVCQTLKPLLKADSLVISIAAGITLASLASWLGEQQALVRCMPNTPSLVGCGATALVANDNCADAQQTLAGQILEAVGIACWLEQESDIDIVTALSGSGPAYYFLMMEAMESAAISMGLDAAVARQLAIQTAQGAGKLAANSDVPPAELRRRVTSPGGTTEQALLSFEGNKFTDIVATAMQAARQRAAELAGNS